MLPPRPPDFDDIDDEEMLELMEGELMMRGGDWNPTGLSDAQVMTYAQGGGGMDGGDGDDMKALADGQGKENR